MLVSLPSPVQDLWKRYANLERLAPREERLAALTVFIEALLQLPEETWQTWAWSVAQENVERRGGIVVRGPLFEQVVFPALLSGLEVALPGCARWLAGMVQDLYRCPACREKLGLDRSSEYTLLRIAIAHDPSDRWSWRRLIEVIAGRFSYSLHELPAGVLFGVNGAMQSQCWQLRQELCEFEAMIARDGVQAKYDDLVQACRLHFAAYEEYLSEKPRQGNYAEFLARHGHPDGGR